MQVIDMMNKQMGRLTVISRVESKSNRATWLCKCSCGTMIVVEGYSLRSGNTKSCGCLQKDKATVRLRTHGMSSSSLYITFNNMHRRCEDVRDKNFIQYGARGISVCSKWSKFEDFYIWATANGYRKGLTIERIDNNGKYCPENCKWVNRKIQARNTRRNHFLTYNGITCCIAEWAEVTGICGDAIKDRITRYKWSIERALTTPVRPCKKSKDYLKNYYSTFPSAESIEEYHV